MAHDGCVCVQCTDPPQLLLLSRGYREKGLYKSLSKHKDHIQEPSGAHGMEQLAGEGGVIRGVGSREKWVGVQSFMVACCNK